MEGAEVAALARQHKRLTWQRIGIVAGLTLIAAVAFIISNFVGAIDISPAEVMKGIVNPAGLDDQTRTVLWQLRLPMAVMAVLIGMALSLAGAEMQTILNNPLAEPFTLGISAAAAFGGATSIVLKWQLIAQPQFNLALVAWLSAAVATAIIVIAAVIRGAKAETMVLLGIGFPLLALKGVPYRAMGAAAVLRRNLLVYGLGGILVPFLAIKLIDLLITPFMR